MKLLYGKLFLGVGIFFLSASPLLAQQSVDVDVKIKKLFDLVNEYRLKNNLTPFKPSVGLTKVAEWMGKDMAANNYMSHTDSLGRDPFKRMDDLGYNVKAWRGENVAAGYETAEATLEGWKNSPGHNANLLRPEFTMMGLGRAYKANTTYGWYWAQEFGGYLDVEAIYILVNKLPRGVVDGLTCDKAWGWAKDNDSTPPVYIKTYRDGPEGAGGIFVERFTANETRSDLSEDVGFNWAVPSSLRDGASHVIYFYGVDSDDGPNGLLSGAPMSITCPTTSATVAADLIVKSSALTPENPKVGDFITFRGTIVNQGSADAGISFFSLRVDKNNDGTWDEFLGQISTGESVRSNITIFTGSWIEIWQATYGTHRYEICSDAGGSVAESNENNNCSIGVFAVSVATSPSKVATTTLPQVPPAPPPPQEPTATSTLPDTSSIPEGALIRAKGDIDIWIVKYVESLSINSGQAKKFKRLILSPNVFNSYGHLRWENVIEVEPSLLTRFTTSDLVRADGDTKIYRLFAQGDTGVKRWIPTAEAFVGNGFDWDAVYTINNADRDAYSIL